MAPAMRPKVRTIRFITTPGGWGRVSLGLARLPRVTKKDDSGQIRRKSYESGAEKAPEALQIPEKPIRESVGVPSPAGPPGSGAWRQAYQTLGSNGSLPCSR